MPSRDDSLWISDIYDGSLKILAWSEGTSEEVFLARGIEFSAIIREFIVIGEAAKHVSADLQALHPSIPWRSLAGFRDVLAHNYFGIRAETVWHAALISLPPLLPELRAIVIELDEGPLS